VHERRAQAFEVLRARPALAGGSGIAAAGSATRVLDVGVAVGGAAAVSGSPSAKRAPAAIQRAIASISAALGCGFVSGGMWSSSSSGRRIRRTISDSSAFPATSTGPSRPPARIDSRSAKERPPFLFSTPWQAPQRSARIGAMSRANSGVSAVAAPRFAAARSAAWTVPPARSGAVRKPSPCVIVPPRCPVGSRRSTATTRIDR
jgi:hypothetical protein